MAFRDLTFGDENEFLAHATDISDTLANLTYLICVDADYPARVRLYAEQANERLRALGSLLRSAGCEEYVSLNH